MSSTKVYNVCHLIRCDSEGKPQAVLLKLALHGISEGYWNAPGGKIETNETIAESAIREVYEETGLEITEPYYHGNMRFHFDTGVDALVYLFSVRGKFDQEVKESAEGPLKWFPISEIPIKQMWDDDKYWLGLMLEGYRFTADFYYTGMTVSHADIIRLWSEEPV